MCPQHGHTRPKPRRGPPFPQRHPPRLRRLAIGAQVLIVWTEVRDQPDARAITSLFWLSRGSSTNGVKSILRLVGKAADSRTALWNAPAL